MKPQAVVKIFNVYPFNVYIFLFCFEKLHKQPQWGSLGYSGVMKQQLVRHTFDMSHLFSPVSIGKSNDPMSSFGNFQKDFTIPVLYGFCISCTYSFRITRSRFWFCSEPSDPVTSNNRFHCKLSGAYLEVALECPHWQWFSDQEARFPANWVGRSWPHGLASHESICDKSILISGRTRLEEVLVLRLMTTLFQVF